MALDRSVNLESNAFIGSILDGVVKTEDDAGGAAEAEVAFTLFRKKRTKTQRLKKHDNLETYIPDHQSMLIQNLLPKLEVEWNWPHREIHKL